MAAGWPWLAAVVVWVTVFLVIAVPAGNVFGAAVIYQYRLAVEGKKVAGTVTALEPANHGGCRYTYSVDGAVYSRSEEGCGTGLGVGAGVTVTCVPSDPRIATGGDAGTQFRDRLIFMFLVPTLFAGLFYVARRGRDAAGAM